MPTIHEIAREYTEPIEGLAPFGEILTVVCTCGKELSTYTADRAATSKSLATEHAAHAASMHDAEMNWTITRMHRAERIRSRPRPRHRMD